MKRWKGRQSTENRAQRRKRGKILCVLMSLLFVFNSLCLAQEMDIKKLFLEGNDYYQNGGYEKAIETYEKILGEGYQNGPLYYNLAGAYFKTGRLGQAILNYERAAIFMPRDSDLTANYKFAQAMVRARILPARTNRLTRILTMYSRNFTIRELTFMCSGAYILILLLIFAALTRFGPRGYLLLAAGLFLVFITVSAFAIYKKAEFMDSAAVVIKPEEDALFGPFESATKFFTVYEGGTVSLVRTRGEWCKIERQDGKAGWVKRDAISKLEKARK